MIEALADYDGSDDSKASLVQAFSVNPKSHQRRTGVRSVVREFEEIVANDPAGAFSFDSDGFATLGSYQAGRFRCRSIGELYGKVPRRTDNGRLTLWLFEGTGSSTDIGSLQAVAPSGTLFQVASQYNCLEAPRSRLVPVEAYFEDPTQGPRASISAFPGTLLRHYSAPGLNGERFVQLDGRPQINLLHRVTGDSVAQVSNGYLMSKLVKDPKAFAELLSERFEDIEIGHHENVQVVLGANWDGEVSGCPVISQVLTSTLAAGLYGKVNFRQKDWLQITQQLQRAAYLGTLLAAVSTGCRYVVLTLIGGGVFGNPAPVIWDSIVWACREVQSRIQNDLTVVVNGRDLSRSMSLSQPATDVQEFGGEIVRFGANGVAELLIPQLRRGFLQSLIRFIRPKPG